MKYAQIKNGIIINIIVLNNLDFYDVFLSGFDYLIRVDTRSTVPGIGWSYDPVNDIFYNAEEEG